MDGSRRATSEHPPAVGLIEPRSSGREEEVAALFQRHYTPMCRLAYVILGNGAVAEEVVMEAMVKTYTGWFRIRDLDKSEAYLRRAVVNLCRSRIRRAAIEARVNAVAHARDRDRPGDSAFERRETELAVWDAVRSLPERQRACVVLRYYEDLPETEIADALGCSVGTVKSQLSKARAKLGRALGDHRPRGV
jgi:RNA polymerase sigma-70 factor (sigma-E family)